MYRCPIDYFQGNLIFNADKSCWAVFRLAGFDYDFLSVEGKIDVLNQITRVFYSVMSEAQILILPVQHDTKEHFQRLRKKIRKDDPLQPIALDQINKIEDYLKNVIKLNGATNDYRTYFLIKLEQYSEYEAVGKWKEIFDYFLKDPINAVNVHMSLDTKDILESKVRAFRKMANEWLQNNRHKLRMDPADTQEVQWLFRRMAYRGMNKSVQLFYDSTDRKTWEPKAEVVEVKKEKIIKPLGKDIVNLFQGTIRRGKRYIEVETEDGVSYQSYLSIINLPEVADFPGSEWIYLLQQWNAQAEVCIHLKIMDFRASLEKLDKKKTEITSQMEHVREARAKIPPDLFDAQYYAEEMEKEIKDSRSPILQTSVSICVAASTRDDLERRCTLIREAYQDMNFVVERPAADQVKMFFQFIPSVGSTIKDFIMPITPRTLAAGIIGATHELGDHEGHYIGTTGKERKPVFLEMGLASLLDESPAATFYGRLGVGKSFNANLLLFLNVIFGGYGIIFDPKGERSHWETDLKPLKGYITTVTIGTSPEDEGMLDAYKIYNNMDDANALAISIITELFKIHPSSEEYTALLEATSRIEEGEDPPSMMKLVRILGSFEKDDFLYDVAKNLSRKLELQRKNGMARLLIGDGNGKSINLDNRLTIIQIQNLKMPSPETEKAEYSTEETLSVVIFMVLSQYAKKFAMLKRPGFKIILFDESWMLGKTKEGVQLYEFISRQGRSLYVGAIFNGHSVLDLPNEGIKNTITYKFCFKTTNSNEIQRTLEYLNLEHTPQNEEVLKNLKNAECLFQDLYGHVGKLKFDAVFQDIINVFSTTPKTGEDTDQELQPAAASGSDQELRPAVAGGSDQELQPDPEAAAGTGQEIDPVEFIDIYEREVI